MNWLKNYLILMGASVVGFVVFAILHNVISAVLNIEEPVFFFLSVVLCPLAFLVGAIGSIVLGIKKLCKKGKKSSKR